LPKFSKYHFFLGKEKRKKKCYDLDIGQNLTEFVKIPIPESLKIFINKQMNILRILARFNSKSYRSIFK
jgi:hypothetical protein